MTDSEKQEPFHLEDPSLQDGHPVKHVLTTSSQQDENIAPDLQIRAVIVTIASGIFWIIQVFTLTVLAAYSRNIVNVLGDSAKLPWVFNAFNVVTIVAAPILSYFSDAYGRKWFIIAPLMLGAVGAVIASRAHSTNVVIVGTTFIGFAGSPLGITTAIPSEVLPHRYRSGAASIVFFLSAFGSFPALIGVSKAISVDPVNGWRWMFYAMIAGYTVQSLLWLVAYRPPPRSTELTQHRPSLDYVGYALLSVATVVFLMGVCWGGVTFPWKSGHVLGTLIPGIILYILFGAWGWKGRTDGLLHHGLFQNLNFPLVVFAILIEGYVYLSFSNLYPGQLATVYEHDTFEAGQRATPFYGTFSVSLLVGGYVASRTRDTITPVIVGYTLLTAALIGFIFAKPGRLSLFIGMDALAGIGFAQPLMLLTVVAQFAAPPSLIALATAIVLSVRALGGAIGIAVANTILNSKLDSKLPAYIASAVLPMGLDPSLLGTVISAAAGDTTIIGKIEAGTIPGVTLEILGAASSAAARAYSDSYKYCWIATVPLSVMGTLSIFLLKRNKKQLDYIIDQPLEGIHHSHAKQRHTGHA